MKQFHMFTPKHFGAAQPRIYDRYFALQTGSEWALYATYHHWFNPALALHVATTDID